MRESSRTLPQWLWTGLAGLLLWLATGEAVVGLQQPVVRFYLFYGETCPHCHEIMENYLPAVYEKYGEQVEHQYFEIYSDTDNYLVMLGLEKKLGLPEDRQGRVPALIVGDVVLVGTQEISDNLENSIERYLAQGGVDYPSLEDLPEVILPTPEPTVQALVFFDPGHRDGAALNDLIAALGQKYGGRLQAGGVDVTQAQNADKLAELNEALGAGEVPRGTPEVLVGRRLLVGLPEIRSELPGLIDAYLSEGGANIPPWEELVGSTAPETPLPNLEPTAVVQKPIHLAYFEQAGCQECARTTYDLRLIQTQYPQLEVHSFSIEDGEVKALNEWLCEKYGVPEAKRLSTPMVFVGDDVLVGSEATLEKLMAVVGKYGQVGADRTWDDFDPTQAEQRLVDRFRSLGVLTVLGAGLIDGLNPCAFATLVFFISYLAFAGRSGREILFVGVSFALGVFLTYVLVGVGMLKAVQSLSFFTVLGRWVYVLTALLCVILAVLTFRDFFRARRGDVGDMTLKLPMSLRRRIHRVIRESSQVRAFVGMAFVTGFVVSLIELACTGQVYLPTIVYVMSKPELAGQAFLYLLLYCLMFILPLVIVFVLSYLGTTSEQLAEFVSRNTSRIKVLTGVVFVGLGLWMTWTLAPLFGVRNPWNWYLLIAVAAIIVLGSAVLVMTDRRTPKRPVPRRRRRRA